MKAFRRLYVAGRGASLTYCIATNLVEAAVQLGADCRVPDPDDMRIFWTKSGIASMPPGKRAEAFGVSRQAVHNWWRKGGEDLKRVHDAAKEEKERKLNEALRTHANACALDVAKLSGVSVARVRRAAEEQGIKLRSNRRLPPDAELIAMAKGKTWRELAELAGVKLATLRTYVYRNPELTESLRRVRLPGKIGRQASGMLDLKKIREMGKSGVTAYAIAEALKVEMMTIRAHLMRWGKESPNEFPAPYGNKRTNRRTVDGSHGGSADHE